MLSKLSVKKPFTVVVGIIIVLILGVVSYINTGIDLLPSMNLPFIVVVTIDPGAAPEKVEQTITKPIEDGLSTVSNIKGISSTSSEHYSIVIVEFDYEAEVERAYNEVKAALELVALPDDELLQRPIVMKIKPSMLPIMRISIANEGQSIKESNEYLSSVIERLDGIDGVANINVNGLISNLAYININSNKVAGSLLDYISELTGAELSLSAEAKEELRAGLADTARLEDVTPQMLIQKAVEVLRDTASGLPEDADAGIINTALNLIILSLENPDSLVYSIAEQRAEELIANKFILYDNDDSKQIFYDFIDQIVREMCISYVNSQISSLTEFLSPDILGQLLYAQDFDMPSGSIQKGVLSYIVKIGTNVKSRDELLDLPVVSFDLGAELQTRLDQVQTVLSLVALATNGKVTFTESQLQALIEAIYNIYGAPEEPDSRGIGYAAAAAVSLWTRAALPASVTESLPEGWAESYTDYLMLNAPAAWDGGLTTNWRADSLELFKSCFDLYLSPVDTAAIDAVKTDVYIAHIPEELAQAYAAVAEAALPDTIKQGLPPDWRAGLKQIYIDNVDVNWMMPSYAPTGNLAKRLLHIFADNMPLTWAAGLPHDWESQIRNAADASAAPSLTDIIRAAIGRLDADTQDALESLFRERTPGDIDSFVRSSIALLDLFSPEAVTIPEAADGAIPGSAVYTIDFILLKERIGELGDSAVIPLKLSSISDIIFLDDSTRQITTLMHRVDGVMTASGAVNLSIDKEPDKSTAKISKAVAAFLAAEKQTTPSFNYTILSNDGDYIDLMLTTVMKNLIYGGLLAVGILLLFLKEIKATFVVGSSIIISVIATFVMMYFAGITLNVVSMGGLALGVGMLVDNSIVIIENISRMRAQGKNIYAASIQGAKQVTGAIVASTLTTVIVFLPIAFIEGLTKQIFTDMALTITFSLLASLIVALTLVPMATSTVLKKPPKSDGKILVGIKKGYAKSLNFFLNHKLIPLILVTVLFGGSIFLLFKMDTSLFPESDSGSVNIETTINKVAIDRYNREKPLDEAYLTYDDVVEMAIAHIVEETKKYDVIESVGIAKSGGMSVAGFKLGGENLSVSVKLVPEKQRDYGSVKLCRELNAGLGNYGITKGLYSSKASTGNFLANMNLTGGGHTLKLYGKDLDLMKSEANRIKELFIKKDAAGNLMTDPKGDPIYIDGIEQITVSGDSAVEEYRIRIDKTKANRYGLTVAQIFLQVQRALAETGVSHKLSLVENDGTAGSFDVYIYTMDFEVNGWYVCSSGTSEVPVYILNNRTDSGDMSHNEYFVTNTQSGVYVKTAAGHLYIPKGGRIPAVRDGDEFSYILIGEKDGNITYTRKSLTQDGPEIYYKVDRVVDFDIITYGILSSSMMNSSTPSAVVPLYKLLSDECFLRGEDGKILYRDDSLTERIPAGLATSDGFDSISHESKRRVESVSFSFFPEASASDMAKLVRNTLADEYTAPSSISVEDESGDRYTKEVFDTLYLVLALAIVLIYLVMVAQFQSLKSPFIIMFTLPLAFTGCIAALYFANLGMSVMAMIGLVVLMGVVVNNGIVFVDYCNQLIQSDIPRRTALLRTGMDRLRPILMTALTTIIALVITAADKTEGGAMLRPLAMATIGGLTYSTFLTLYIVPIIFDIFNKRAKQTERARAVAEKDIDLITTTEVEDILAGSTESILNDIAPDKGMDDTEGASHVQRSPVRRRKPFIDEASMRYNKKSGKTLPRRGIRD